jgi:hypothetical protein
MKTLNPNNFGNKFLVEDCKKIKINDFLKKFRIKFKKVLLDSELEFMGIKVEFKTSKTKYNGIRLWFACPICGNRVGVLYQHPLSQLIGCRKCLNLDYWKHQHLRYEK